LFEVSALGHLVLLLLGFGEHRASRWKGDGGAEFMAARKEREREGKRKSWGQGMLLNVTPQDLLLPATPHLLIAQSAMKSSID
jgi:hypothetical protein